MSAVEEYRKWCFKHVRESVGFDLTDAAIAELEAELAFSQDQRIGAIDRFNGQAMRAEQAEADHDSVAKAYDERYSELIAARAALAERDRMLQLAANDFSGGEGTECLYLAGLRTRAKE